MGKYIIQVWDDSILERFDNIVIAAWDERSENLIYYDKDNYNKSIEFAMNKAGKYLDSYHKPNEIGGVHFDCNETTLHEIYDNKWKK